MASALALTGASGALFGGALRVSGLFDPDLIISQMQLTKFTMVETFVVATAGSSLIFYAFDRIGNPKTPPRAKTSLGSSWTYDGNIIGGVLQGAGMTISGACPGMILIQIATGSSSAPTILAGSLLGGIVYTGKSRFISSKPVVQGPDTKASFWELLNISPLGAELLFQAISITVITYAHYAGPQPATTPVPPIYGGLLVVGAQLSSLLLTGNTLGVSGAYEEAGRWFWWTLDRTTGRKSLRPPVKNIVFAISAGAGAWAVPYFGIVPQFVPTTSISNTAALCGGFLIVFGARLAQGCPSGHGISGFGGLSTASLVTVASMFAGGILTAFFF